MSLIRLNRYLLRQSTKCYSTAVTQNEEYTAVPHYPPILDPSPEKVRERRKQSEHDEIKSVKTIEEKQIKLNMPRYYGFKCYEFHEDVIPYDNLKLAQHITRTHLKIDNNLSDYYKDINVDSIAENLKAKFEDALTIELDGYKTRTSKLDLSPNELENIITAQIVKQVNRAIMNNMVQDYSHLLDVQVDVEPRLEAFWFAGGMNPPKNIKKYRTGKGQDFRKHTENDPTDRLIAYDGKPLLTLRSCIPLKPLMSYQEANIEDLEVPKWRFDPRVVGTMTKHSHMANIPGFWPGDPHHFGVLSYHKRGHIINRPYNDLEDDKEALHRQAILQSFAWLHSQANYQGFTTFNDITYPIVTQSVITNGQVWSFYSYQMNTMLVHGTNIDTNPKVNICYATPEVKLFEEFKDGKLVGFNDDVLKMLLRFYANVPEERMGVNLHPYLSQSEKTIADYTDVEKREWLEREYKFLVSHRPRYKLGYEVYNWEKIYKVDFKTRPMEPRRRPFELMQKPSNRRLDDRKPFYIPRALRPDLPRNKGRDAKEYFP